MWILRDYKDVVGYLPPQRLWVRYQSQVFNCENQYLLSDAQNFIN